MPPLSGFFSKDAILASALAREDFFGVALFVVGVSGALLTGLYTFRMIFIVFGGDPSPYAREHFHRHAHGEGPFSMTSTVTVLAVLAAIGGWIQIAGIWHPLADWLDPIRAVEREHLALVEPSVLQDWITSLVAVAAGLVGIGLAWAIYSAHRIEVPRIAPVQTALEHKLYVDEAYDLLFFRPAALLGRAWNRWVEGPVIGGSLKGLGETASGVGRGLSEAQTGLLRTYALAIAGGVAVLALVFLSVR
jgi:NADH-quinone oxidoreductase subunit L